MDEYRCYKCGAESTIEVEVKDEGRIIQTRHLCDECLMELILELQKITTDFEIEEDVE